MNVLGLAGLSLMVFAISAAKPDMGEAGAIFVWLCFIVGALCWVVGVRRKFKGGR